LGPCVANPGPAWGRGGPGKVRAPAVHPASHEHEPEPEKDMQGITIRNLIAAGFPAALLLAVVACEEPPPPEVWFISPSEGEEVEGPHVLAELGARGVEIVSADIHEPGTGHHHIYVNVDLTPLDDTIPQGVPGILHLGQGQTEFLVRDLEPGDNRFIAVLAHWDHVPFDPPVVDTVHFTVVAPEGGDEEEEGEGAEG